MINYHVKKKRRTRYTFRFVGLAIIIICVSQIAAFFMGYGQSHRLGTFIAAAFCMYGIYLFLNSFRSGAYDIDYEFRNDDFMIHTHYGEKVYRYDEITDLNQIIPENDMIYSIIQIAIGSKQYILPFSYKKEVADKLYAFLNERVVTQTLDNESLKYKDGGENSDDK